MTGIARVPRMGTPEEKRIEEELSHAILLSERVLSAVDEAESFKSECSELGKQVGRLSQMLRSLVLFTTSVQSLYDRPIRRVAPDVSRNLERALALARRCKPQNILRRVVTIISVTDFRKIANLLDSSLGDLKWLLSVFGFDGKGGGIEISLPPIASNEPILSWVWSFIASIHMGPLPDRIEAANELASLARANDRSKTIIVEEGGVPALFKLLKESSDPDAQKSATTALHCLANDQEVVQAIVNELGVQNILQILPLMRPSMPELRGIIEDRQSQPLPDQIIKANDDSSERTRKPPDGVLEVSERVYGADENEVPELPVESNIKSTSTLPTMPPSLSESSVNSALEGTFGSFESATKSPYTSPSFELDQQYGTTVEGNGQSLSQSDLTGDNTEYVRGEEIAAVTETNMEVASVSDSASSSAVNNGSVEATASVVSSSAQFPDVMLPKQEKLYQQNGSPSSASMSSGYDYDVFLSFRGPDTRSGITDFLYTSFLAAGIHTFKDDEELRVGEEFGPELLKAISQSKIAIPIFSKGYASSKWCLNELVQMVECSKTRRQKVMPIFYDVTPAEVRHQIGSYEKAFLLHKEKFGANVSKWKAALRHVANLNGWDNSKKDRGEGELVDEIVQEVISELKTAYLLVTDCLVGVENHVKEIDAMMCCDSEDIRILGIHGMGGVGKTTLAKIIYNRLSHHFEACCFLSNIRETSELKGIEGLQNQLISDVLKKQWSNIGNVEEGIKIIKERLCGKKVLVLLDDVDQMTHWDALIGKPAWFGLGSKIIITSRNKDIVDVPEVCHPYELMSMNFNQSLQLFCKHAFGRDYPSDDYVAFSTEVVKTTGGLPLALEAIGKLLPCRNKDVWDVILKKLKQVPLNEVKRKLKISYDALDDWQKHIFLDIACLFTGFDHRIVLHSWKDSNLYPEEGLEVLQKMSLIKIGEDNKLWMHDQLRGLGRDIVRRECDKERRKKTIVEPCGRFGHGDGNEGDKKK